MARQCKKCKKVTRKKKIGLFTGKPRCKGCGSFDFIDIADALVVEFDFEDLLYSNDEGYNDFEDMEVMEKGPVEVVEDSFVEQEDNSSRFSSSEPAYTPEPEPDRSYGSSSFGSDSSSSSFDSGSSDCGSCDCGGCD